MAVDFRDLQKEVENWSMKNFGDQSAHLPLLGVGEETGELMHAYLKMSQGIRGDKSVHMIELMDAVGDIVIYLLDFCSRMDVCFEDCVKEAWKQVAERDWTTERKDNGII